MKTKSLFFNLVLTLLISQLQAQQINVSFLAPDTVCVNEPVTYTNNSTGPIDSYYWRICSGNATAPTVTSNLANPSNTFSWPAYLTIVQDGINYYMFVTNNLNGRLLRLDYGNSLNNTPTAIDLGFVINNLEDIHVEKEGANWYGIVLGGMSSSSAVCRLDFGTSITNVPTVTNMGNIGMLDYPVTLQIFRSGGSIYGLTFSYGNNTITRFNFGTSLSSVPTGTNLGNIGALASPAQMSVIHHNGNWHVFICNDNFNPSVSRLDFGNSLLNTPTGVNLGNLGGLLDGPRGICLWTECNGIKGYIANRGNDLLFDLSFPAGATGSIVITPAVNTSIIGFPQTIRRYRIGNIMATYIVNVTDNSISRIDVSSCQYLPSSTLQNMPAVTFTALGTYTAYLASNESSFNQSSYCKTIVVTNSLALNVIASQTACIGKPLVLLASGAQNYTWSTGAVGPTVSILPMASQVYTVVGSGFQVCKAQKTVSVSVFECVGLSEWELEKAIKVFPTPTTGKLTLEISSDAQIVLTNALGSILFQKNCKAGIQELNIEDVKAGIYTISAITREGVFNKKVLKE